MQKDKCIVAIRTPDGARVKAFDVCIRGEDVYTNYCDIATPEAHASYHKSGQYHMKKGGQYIEWTGGFSGEMEPMKLYRTPPGSVLNRERFWTIGWEAHKISAVLPALLDDADFMVDSTGLAESAILAFEASVVGEGVKERKDIVGFPVIASHRFGSSVTVELCSFVVQDE